MKVGVLGGGQLGRMLALEGYPLGLSFRFLEPQVDASVRGLGEIVVAAYDDTGALDRFAEGLDVVTYEFENVPEETARRLASHVPVYPPPAALHMAQDRLREKQGFESLGIPTATFAPIDGPEDVPSGLARVGLPAVLKTRRLGYDGKGQAVVRTERELRDAVDRLGRAGLLLEAFVPFRRELSIIGVRARDGREAFYPLAENEHRGGILHSTVAPAPGASPALQPRAEDYLGRLLERLDYVGVLTLELFEVDGRLLANEMAPRVHNSGHWTLDGAVSSQFENHLRAVCGYPLGSTVALGFAGMLNLVGTVPAPEHLLAIAGARLHLYGKASRPGRKLGHVNVLAAGEGEVREILARVEAAAVAR